MNDEKIKQMIANGIVGAGHTELVQAYTYITGKPNSTGCSSCFRRQAIKVVVDYYNKL